MSFKKDLERIGQQIPVVPEDRNYWLIRTEGGRYYDTFKFGGYIGIGYNFITSLDLMKLQDSKYIESLKERVQKHDPKNQRPGLAINQLKKFAFEINRNDVVIIPSESLEELSMGVVFDDDLSYSKDFPDDDCPFEKRRKISWRKTIPKAKIHPVLYKLFFSHQTVVSANNYDKFIDKSMHDFFRKGNSYHLVLDVKAKEDINALGFFSFGNELLSFADEFSSELGIDASIEGFDIRSTVESPGLIELIGYSVFGGMILGIVTVAIVGGKFRIKNFIGELEFETPGFWDKFESVFNRKKPDEKKKIAEFIEISELEAPDELLALEKPNKAEK